MYGNIPASLAVSHTYFEITMISILVFNRAEPSDPSIDFSSRQSLFDIFNHQNTGIIIIINSNFFSCSHRLMCHCTIN